MKNKIQVPAPTRISAGTTAERSAHGVHASAAHVLTVVADTGNIIFSAYVRTQWSDICRDIARCVPTRGTTTLL